MEGDDDELSSGEASSAMHQSSSTCNEAHRKIGLANKGDVDMCTTRPNVPPSEGIGKAPTSGDLLVAVRARGWCGNLADSAPCRVDALQALR